MRTLSIVIPCHNEAGAIPQVMRELELVREDLLESGFLEDFQVLAVDDGSTDGTGALLANIPWVDCIRVPERSGYGEALKAGFRACRGEIIGFFDLDGTYSPEDLIGLLSALEISGADFVLGERLSQGEGMPFLRAIGNSFFSWMVRRLYGYPVRDACTGLRLFRRERLGGVLDLNKKNLDFSLALTIWKIRERIPFLECAVQYRERSGRSKLNVFLDGLRFLYTILDGASAPGRLR